MEKDKLESTLIDYIDGRLNEADKQTIEEELVRNAEAYKLYEQLKELVRVMDRPKELEPGKEVKQSFEQFLQQEIIHQPKARSVFFQPMVYRVAATVTLLILAGVVGFWIYKDQQHEQELAAIRKEMEETKRMMMTMMGNEQSASQRITGVSVANQLVKADDEVVSVLVKTMNEDPNTNVRMAALEALSKFHQEPTVRKALIESLVIQKDPVVQIALIQLLVTIKEKGVMKDLERMTKDKTIMKAVKDEAYSGILKLS
jgi:HEAT repeat protein